MKPFRLSMAIAVNAYWGNRTVTDPMFFYSLSRPLDMGWEFLQRANDFADKLAVEAEHDRLVGWLTQEGFVETHQKAKKFWQKQTGNTSEPNFCLLWFPSDNGCLCPVFITKDCECNGMTSVVSLVNLKEWVKHGLYGQKIG